MVTRLQGKPFVSLALPMADALWVPCRVRSE